jgi:hypothetical protein
MIDQNYLKSRLRYNPDTGEFIWLSVSSLSRTRVGSIARARDSNGYRIIKLKGKRYYQHRLAWLYVYGEWPSALIDHIDCDPSNNRISNLRLATYGQNVSNSKKVISASGYRGVYLMKSTGRWLACVTSNGKRTNLGYHATKEEAFEAYKVAAIKLHGEFARLS